MFPRDCRNLASLEYGRYNLTVGPVSALYRSRYGMKGNAYMPRTRFGDPGFRVVIHPSSSIYFAIGRDRSSAVSRGRVLARYRREKKDTKLTGEKRHGGNCETGFPYEPNDKAVTDLFN